MVRRAGAFVLALVVTGAPASLTACEILCAARADRALQDESSPQHSCHSTQPGDNGVSVISGVHVCGHSEELPMAPGTAVPNAAPGPAVTMMAPSPVLHLVDVSRRPATSRDAHSRPHAPLRI